MRVPSPLMREREAERPLARHPVTQQPGARKILQTDLKPIKAVTKALAWLLTNCSINMVKVKETSSKGHLQIT